MKAMQSLVKIPEIQATMRELSKEMMKVIVLVLLCLQTPESPLSWGWDCSHKCSEKRNRCCYLLETIFVQA